MPDGYIRSRDLMKAIGREMRRYDVLGKPSSIRYVPSVIADADVTPHDKGVWQCAHAIAFDQPCVGCERHSTDRFVYVGNCIVLFMPADTRVYIQAKLYRIKEVLKLLGMLP